MKGSNLQVLIWLLIAVAGVSTILTRSSRSPDKPPKTPDSLFFPSLEVTAIDRVEIASPDGSLALARAGADWLVEGAPRVYADAAKVGGAVREAASLSRHDVASVVTGKDAPFGLEEDRATRVSLSAAGVRVAEFAFGERGPGGAGTYARPSGGRNVYLVPSTLGAVFPTDPAPWRDRRPLRFPIEDSRRLSIEHAGDRVELAVLDDGRWHMLRPRKEQAATRKVERALVLLAALSAKGFADGRAPAECGLDKGSGSAVTIELVGGGSVGIRFGRREGPIRYAMTDGRPTIYEVSAEMVEEILLAPGGFLP